MVRVRVVWLSGLLPTAAGSSAEHSNDSLVVVITTSPGPNLLQHQKQQQHESPEFRACKIHQPALQHPLVLMLRHNTSSLPLELPK